MRRGLAALLICAALALLGTWAWLLIEPASLRDGMTRAAQPKFCGIERFCVHAAPPPIELRRGEAALASSHRDHPLIGGAVGPAGTGSVYPYERLGEAPAMAYQPETSRLYLARFDAGDEALVIVRDTSRQRHALLVRRGPNLAAYRLRTDADLSLRRFALLDPATGAGDTFELRQDRRSETFTYVTLAPRSAQILEQWLSSQRSTCGYGPLTAVPREWRRDYQRLCSR